MPTQYTTLLIAEVNFPKVDVMGRVRKRTNFYSAPLRVGTEIEARVHTSCVELRHVHIWYGVRLTSKESVPLSTGFRIDEEPQLPK
jgi:hypothetical protein